MNQRFYLLIAIAFGLTGCETMQQNPQKTNAQYQRESIVLQLRSADQTYAECHDALKATGITKRLYEELVYENDSSPNKFSLMTNEESPSNEQVEYLKKAIPEIIKCRSAYIDGLSGTPFQKVQLTFANGIDEIYIKLMRREINIGKANEYRSKLLAQRQNEWIKSREEMDERLRAQHESEISGRMQAASAMLPYMLQQQQNQQMQQHMLYQQQMQNIINNRPILKSPSTTNCTTYGNQTNCTTR